MSRTTPPASPTAARPVRRRRRLGVLGALAGVALSAAALTVAPIAFSPAESAIGIPSQGSSVAGAWSTVLDWPVIAIHAVVSADGKVVTWGNSTAAPPNNANHYYDVWDPSLGTGSGSHVRTANPHDKIFCSGQYVSPTTGEILTFGGTKYPGGSAQLGSFDPETLTLNDVEDPMAYPRWYPTATVLQDNRALLQGGTDVDFDGTPQITPELYTPGTGWKTLTGASRADIYGDAGGISRWYYPRTWVQPDGRIFVINQDQMYYVDVDGNNGTGRIHNVQPWTRARGVGSTAVMYAPGKILHLGGHTTGGGQASNQATVVDVTSGSPVVTPTSSMQYRREWHNATVLPDGKVLVTGGSGTINEEVAVAYQPEVWDPETGNWTTLGASVTPRLYHSTAILLPDASVLTAGGGDPGPRDHTSAEIFYPPYLYRGNGSPASRPAWSAAPTEVPYDAAFDAYLTNGSPISRVTMVKTGSVTHSFDMEQRFIELEFTQSGGTVTVESPPNPNVATPGHYMLYALDANGTPSVAQMVRVAGDIDAPNAPTSPPGIPNTPPVTPTAAPGPTPPSGNTYKHPRLRVTTRGPKSTRRGRKVTYRFNVNNRGPGRATKVTLAARVPKSWKLIKRNRKAVRYRKGRLIWRAGSVKVRKRKFVVVKFRVPRSARGGRVRITAAAKGKNTGRALRRRSLKIRR